MEQQFTVKEVIGFSVKDLKGLSIPVDMIPTVGVVLARVVGNLESCYEAISRGEEAEKKQEPKYELEVLDAGTVDEIPEGAQLIDENGGE